ncbi:MAG: hypothetical protein DRO99_03240 [Candidatus Aenigmatarchaeota archaeon]|nr:MAG: hypothetical protein DRO99_03240 [Candidatus Aenigmarchaeota archaeon]
MDDSFLMRLAILCSISGLAVLFLFSSAQGTQTMIGDITAEDIGRNVMVCGEITDTRISNNHVFLTLYDGSGSIRYVIFNSTSLMLNKTGMSPFSLSKGMSMCGPGAVDEYPAGTGNLELIYRRGVIEIS